MVGGKGFPDYEHSRIFAEFMIGKRSLLQHFEKGEWLENLGWTRGGGWNGKARFVLHTIYIYIYLYI